MSFTVRLRKVAGKVFVWIFFVLLGRVVEYGRYGVGMIESFFSSGFCVYIGLFCILLGL